MRPTPVGPLEQTSSPSDTNHTTSYHLCFYPLPHSVFSLYLISLTVSLPYLLSLFSFLVSPIISLSLSALFGSLCIFALFWSLSLSLSLSLSPSEDVQEVARWAGEGGGVLW